MKKFLKRLVWVPLGLIALLFLFANRQPVSISLDPFSTTDPALASPALSLWIWLMLMLLLGFALGAGGAWVSGRTERHQARADRRELKALRKELAAAAMAAPGDAGSKGSLPALPAE